MRGPGAAILLALTLSPFAGGCGSDHRPLIAADSSGRPDVGRLIDMLGSDDPVERMASIGSLHRLAGTDFGYDPTAPQPSRDEAIDRWVQWRAEGMPRG